MSGNLNSNRAPGAFPEKAPARFPGLSRNGGIPCLAGVRKWSGTSLFRVSFLVLLVATLAGCSTPAPITPGIPAGPLHPPVGAAFQATDTSNVFEKYQFQKVHGEFQQSYLELINAINENSQKGIDTKEQRALFSTYLRKAGKYREVRKEISENEKNQQLRCFSVMKSLILAIMYYDKKFNKKMFKFDPEKLVLDGVLPELPRCPDGGKYTIISRDGRRYFRCSLHGTLRQN